MEILNNFSMIYCFITFILGAMFMFTTLCIAAMCKTQEQRNMVHFYVARDKNDNLWIYLGKPIRGVNMFKGNCDNSFILTKNNLKSLGLNEKDYADLKWEDEPVEDFITLKD